MDQTLEDSEEIQALSELLQDPIGLVDISLTGERTEFLKRLTTNSNSVIGELPEDQRAASIIFTPSLLTSFDWGRDELAISFFLDYQRDPGSDALAGLLRLASLSCQGSEVVYQSEAANLLGITLVCKSISLGQIEEGFTILKERGLVLDHDILATTELIIKRAEEMKWVTSLLAETKGSDGSKAARATLELIYNHRTDRIDELFKLSKEDKLWVFAKLYERFCDATLPEATRISAIRALHEVTTSLKTSIEEIYSAPLDLVASIDLSLEDLKRFASDLIEEDIFGGGLLLSIAAQKLEDKTPDSKRRILNLLAVAWDYCPTSSTIIESYCASALELGHINLSYLKVNDPLFKGERPETFNDFCSAVKNFDSSKSKISPLLPPKNRISVFRVFGASEYDIRTVLNELVRECNFPVNVLSHEAVFERSLEDLKSLNLLERDKVIDRLIELNLIPATYNRKQKNLDHLNNLIIPIYISHIADRVIPDGTGLTYRALRQRVLEVGRNCPKALLHMALSSVGKPYFSTILQIANTFDLSIFDNNLSGARVEIHDHRDEILEHILKEVRDSHNPETILFFFLDHHLDQFSMEEIAEAFLNVAKDINNEGYSISSWDERKFENLLELLPRIPTDLPISKKIADFLLGTIQSSYLDKVQIIMRERSDARRENHPFTPEEKYTLMLRAILEYVKKSGFSDPSIKFQPFHDAGLIRMKTIFKIAAISTEDVKISLCSEFFNQLPSRTEKDPRKIDVFYPDYKQIRFITGLLEKPEFGLKIVLGILEQSKLANNPEIYERVAKHLGIDTNSKSTAELKDALTKSIEASPPISPH